jgi:hypothetical protein
MVMVCPATVMVPFRALPVVFAATLKVTGPLPVPLLPDVIVIQEALLAAVQEQLLEEAVTVVLPVPD